MTTSPTPRPDPAANLPWYRGLSKYHWFVLAVCWLAWFFDTMAQQLFVLARTPAMTELLGPGVAKEDIKFYGGVATMILMFGWATGGIVFGILGDRWGRAKTMIVAVLCYSIFTALSALSVSWIDFSIYRFLMGLGVGGTFGAAVAFVAEVMPPRSRPYALGFLQALAAVGNMTAACISFALPPGGVTFGVSGWRALFVVSVIPAILAVLMMKRLKEPESWVRAKEAAARGEVQQQGKNLGGLRELFGDRRWLRNLIVGIVLGLAGIMGLWGIGFWQPELVRDVVGAGSPEGSSDPLFNFFARFLPIKATPDFYVSLAMLLFNGAAAIGTYFFAILMGRVGRRPAFAMMFVVAIAAVFGVFGFMSTPSQIWWMAPLLGLGTLTVFGGYSIYFPELFPTRLRATGVGFCYNTARYVAATAPFTLGLLATVYADWDLHFLSSMGGVDSGFRYAAFTVAGVFVAGLLVLPFAPETKGKPLPE
jgi:MFS family permease